jgi:hypothetical protein
MFDPRVRRAAARLFVLCVLIASLAGSSADGVAAAQLPHALMSAAHRSTHADRALVLDARKLKLCLLAKPHRSGHCAAARQALQHAGRRLAVAERRLARIARATGASSSTARSASRRHGQRTAPRLFVSGRALKWTHVAGVRSYLLVRKVPGQAKQYSVVSGTSVVPPPMPGMTVHYSVRTTVAMSAWAGEQSITYAPAIASTSSSSSSTSGASTTATSSPATINVSDPSTPPATPETALDPQTAPQLVVSGQTLSWNPVAGVGAYVLVRTVPGHAPEYSEVSTTSLTPPATAGATVYYSVRTAIPGSAWGAEVTISYPAASPTPPPVTEPTPPGEESTASAAGFQPGINAGPVYPGQLDLSAASELGAKIVRVEFAIETPAAQLQATIEGYAAIGVRVAPVATFRGRIPTPAEAQNLAGWAQTYGPGGNFWASRDDGALAIQTIEFGNETNDGYQYGDEAGDASYTARAELYATRLKEAAEAISAAGVHVGLLSVSEDWTGDWMKGMFSAVPHFGNYVAGWVSHPYGPSWKTSLETIIRQAAAHGAPPTIPIDITEWGLTSDSGRCLSENYGWNPCMNYQEAAEALNTSVAGMRHLLGARLGLFLLYQIRDQQPSGASNEREAYFGALQHEMQPKGAYTSAVAALLSSS